MIEPTISDALKILVPDAEWSIIEEDYNNIIWIKRPEVEPSAKDVKECLNKLKSSYSLLRSSEYPSIQEQLDMLYWDKINGTNNWESKISEVKQKYPKEK